MGAVRAVGAYASGPEDKKSCTSALCPHLTFPFRFDFSHGKPVTPEQLKDLDKIVGDLITKQLPVYTKIVSLADAKKIKGLRAVFGEVYPDPVRYDIIIKSVYSRSRGLRAIPNSSHSFY